MIGRLDFIRCSRTAGLTLAQVCEGLDVRDTGTAPCSHVQQLLAARLSDLDQQIAELQALRKSFAELSDAAATVDRADCEPSTVCRYL